MFNCLRIPILSLVLILSGCASAPKDRFMGRDPEWIKHRLIVTVLERQYYKEIDRKECAEAILKGGVSECTDPFTRYISAAEARMDETDRIGHFGGVGMGLEFRQTKGGLEILVNSVKKNAPADRGGVKLGDLLHAVSPTGRHLEMKLVQKLSMAGVLTLIRGEPNTELILVIRREGHYRQIRLVREGIKIMTVESRPIKKGIGYIRLTQFNEETPRDFAWAVRDLKTRGVRALIIDVRNNPGGLLNSVCSVLKDFVRLGETKPLVYIQGRYEENNEVHFSHGHSANFADLKVVVLANGNSASAAEILTAWFKEDYGAVMVGEKTYGKGSVQQEFGFPDGSNLHYTFAHYFVGKKKIPVHEIGVQPAIEVKGDKAQLQKAIAAAEKLLKN